MRRLVNTAALKRRRRELYPTRAAFCQAAGISLAYSKFLDAGRHQPSPRVLRDIAKALNCKVDDLYRDDEPVAA